ncbi:TetR/AcrR family transcriptional regulator [Williamsia sp. 1135]|uniref:TetR/AcrR family transcriptional regulator n=1 Tax=Williamsia sp. 1135 TaxID=1889262 RepID=UPI000A10D1E4|nr:TetR/AcrR family transcriptional regulator [Williamsia sp. 1135]ORM30192.1 TetR family transcriptional regulator [Williamsia sp. 1135]
MTTQEPTAASPVTRRGQAKAARRRELLAAAARLMAERGFAGVRLEDIGAAVGISGPAMYRHFSGKDAVLAEMLVDISQRLFGGGQDVLRRSDDDETALAGLIDFHVRFATTEPELITVQDRDMSSLTPEARREVRRLQRKYVELWTDVLVRLSDPMPRQEAQTRVQAVFGLINSSPRLPELDAARQSALLAQMAYSALLS